MSEYRNPLAKTKQPSAYGVVLEDIPTQQSVFATSTALNFYNYGIANNLYQESKVAKRSGFVDHVLGGVIEQDAELSPLLSPEEANTQGGKYGLKFSEPVRQGVLDLRIKNKRDEIRRQSILNRAPDTFASGAANVGGSLFGAMADPANIAASFVPVVGQARFARMVATMGATKARAAKGFVEGTVGASLMEAPTLALTKRAQADYDMYDSLMNVAFGGIIGGGLHVTGGIVKDKVMRLSGRETLADKIQRTSQDTKYHALKAGIADAIEGRPINVEPILKTDPNFQRNLDDPFDPRNWAEIEPKTPPPPRDYTLGMDINPQTFKHIDAIVGELKDSYVGQRIFQEVDGQGGTPNILAFKGNSPEWFRQYNIEVNKNNKLRQKIQRQNKKLPTNQQRPVPKSQQTITRDKVELVARKMRNKERLGSNEQGIAEMLYLQGLERRAQDVRDMIEYRQARESAKQEEIKQFASRDGYGSLHEFYNDKSGGLSALGREGDALPEPEVRTYNEVDEALDEAMEGIDDMSAYLDTADEGMLKSLGLSRSDIEAELRLLDDEISQAEIEARAIEAFGACMSRG